MFTGIIQDIGIVERLSIHENSIKMSIATNLDESHLSLGASLACNGCCLTVSDFKRNSNKNVFTVDIGFETVALTNFRALEIGSRINLEPALRLGDSLGGHQVSGHIDSLCKIKNIVKFDNEFWKLSLIIPKKFSYLLVPKGSIAVAGISLTIAHVNQVSSGDSLVEIMIIPHTYCNTILQYYAQEMSIEVEFDQTVKAIASILETMLPNYIQARK